MSDANGQGNRLRIAVLGGMGMLGSAVTEAASRRRHHATAVPHGSCNVADAVSVARWFQTYTAQHDSAPPDLIINCAGVRPLPGVSAREMAAVNGLGPYNVAHFARLVGDVQVLHVSTDCVFSGDADTRWPGRAYDVAVDLPDARDDYGRSKAFGEVHAEHVTNVRTSFVGPQHGLWAWLVGEAAAGRPVQGWRNALWSGSTVTAVAAQLVTMAEQLVDGRLMPGRTHHLATAEPVSKHQVLRLLAAHLDLDVRIEGVEQPHINRALIPTVPLMSLASALALEKRLPQHAEAAAAEEVQA